MMQHLTENIYNPFLSPPPRRGGGKKWRILLLNRSITRGQAVPIQIMELTDL